MPILVLVCDGHIRFGQCETAKSCLPWSNRYFLRHRSQCVRGNTRVKYLQLVSPRWNIRNAELTVCIGDCVVGRCYGDYHRTHLRVNVAENERDPGLIEFDKARCPALVQPQIEALPLEKREHVVKKRVAVRKLHLAPGRYHEQ